MGLLTRFLVRTVVLVALCAVALLVIDRSDSTDPLGAGLLLFLVLVVLALVWGVVDGRRGPAGPAIAVWILAGAALGVVSAVETALGGGGTDVLVDDLLTSVPFFAVLVGVPAALGVAVGAVLRRATD